MLRGVLALYYFNFADLLVRRLEYVDFKAGTFLRWFWKAKNFETPEQQMTERGTLVASLVILGAVAQVGWGVWLLIDWARFGTAGAWAFGIALIISYPLVCAHVLALGAWIYGLVYYLIHPKKAGRQIVCAILEHQVRALRAKHPVKVVAVAGSVGKTSTKLAVADLLGRNLRVCHQMGNYNDRVTVPLVFFDQKEPSLFNIVAWCKLFGANQAMVSHPYPYDVVVVELGTDAPGQLQDFAYLHPDITVVTAITPEHMEFFKTLDAVAAEELTVFDYSKQVIVNGDDIPGKYLVGREFTEYSLKTTEAQYFALTHANGLQGQKVDVVTPTGKFKSSVQYLGAQGAKFALAAVAVADLLEMQQADIVNALPELAHFAGRMQVLSGKRNSTLIDDTYNASPVAVCAALDVLYEAKATQRIAVLGSMNEMGEYSQQAHKEVGAYCDPKRLDLVVTIGVDAQRWLAPIAKQNGCTVHEFLSPYDAGEFLHTKLKKGAVVLAKGSQNGVFAEEALKPLLAKPEDADKLVRQSSTWIKKKQTQFGTS